MFAVILADFLMFTVSRENTVKCLDGSFSAVALKILICSSKLSNKILREV